MNELKQLLLTATEAIEDPSRSRIIGAETESTPRFALFHAGFSLCSHKVRVTLAEKNLPYLSHEMILPMENYHPDYVRLRLLAGQGIGNQLAEKHTGRSSVETEGFDPCVVPMLIDHKENEVIVDSKKICEYLEHQIPALPLMPETLAVEIGREVDIIDRAPHPGILYGFHPDSDRRPDMTKDRMKGIHDRKITILENNLVTNADDDGLVRAYRAKISKEKAGKMLALNPECQRAVHKEFEHIVAKLEIKLNRTGGTWFFGETYTFADVVWGITLYRMQWLGLADFWATLPRVGEYAMRAYSRPSMWHSVIQWPHQPPSPHVETVQQSELA